MEVKLKEQYNKTATKARLGQLHGARYVNYEEVYALFSTEQAGNPDYCNGNLDDFREFYGRMLLAPQNDPLAQSDYRLHLEYSYQSMGDYYHCSKGENMPSPNQRMIINVNTQHDALLLAGQLRSVTDLWITFKLFLQEYNVLTAPDIRFKYDKMVIYYENDSRNTQRDGILNLVAAALPSTAFKTEFSAFYDIYETVSSVDSGNFCVGVGLEANPQISFSEFATLYTISCLSGADTDYIYAHQNEQYPVSEAYLSKALDEFERDLFNDVAPHIIPT